MSGVMFGFFMVIAFVVFDHLGSPLVWAAFWGVEAAYLTFAARLMWQRTRLFWNTLAMAHAAATVGCAAVVQGVGGYGTLSALPGRWIVFLAANAVVSRGYMYLD